MKKKRTYNEWANEEREYYFRHRDRVKGNIRTSFFCRQEALEHSLANAKTIAKCWRKAALRHTKIHIRRGYIVTANVSNIHDMIRFFDFAKRVNETRRINKTSKETIIELQKYKYNRPYGK